MAGAPVRALVVEDAPEIRLLLCDLLQREGFLVESAETGAEALDLVSTHNPEIILLDVGLPDMDGLEVCRQARMATDAYIIMLTAKDEEFDKVVGLSVGADDYVTKPFSPRELVARIRAVLRRPRAAGEPVIENSRRHGPLLVDMEAREILLDGQEVRLTRTEFDLLAALAENPRRVLSRQLLLERVWGSAWGGDEHLVEVHISSLRKKLGDTAAASRLVRTVRGVGYRLGTIADEATP